MICHRYRPIMGLSFSPDGKYLTSSSYNSVIKIWDCNNNFEELITFNTLFYGKKSLCFSTDGRYLVSGSYDKTIKIWNCDNNFQEVKTLIDHDNCVNTLSFQPIICDIIW